MSNKFTNEQLAAINAKGKVIVSASAGSGKTTVMIEKIIRLIQSGCDISQVLAVTFTKKAASQMKEKLCKALIKSINDPLCSKEKRKELKTQLSQVPNADISTIHSFCAKLIRTHFYALGIDNGFRVIGGSDAEGTALKNEALDELLEEGYEEKDELFSRLLSVYWRKKSDNQLRKILLTAYDALRDRADYREYLQNSGKYDESVFDEICRDLHDRLVKKSAYYLEYAIEEAKYFEENGGSNAQISLSKEVVDALTALKNTKTYFQACALERPQFTPKRANKNDSKETKRRVERVAALRSATLKIHEELLKTGSREEELENFLLSGKTAEAMAVYLLKFDEKYERLKTERGVLDYNDLEHKALFLLSQEDIVKQIREKYHYVFVDEYQDVNPVQEAILSKVGGENLFLVGDVKQSIYGFRGSKSKFFIDKQDAFLSGEGESLAMKRNFRSADQILDAVNLQFSLAMTKGNAGVDYTADSYMERGGRYEFNSGKVQIHFLPEEEKKKKEIRGVYSVRERTGKRVVEESSLAKTIRHIIETERNEKWYDADKGEYRRVRYSDIAILSRKKQGEIATTVAALAEEGIPVTAAAAVNICDFAEIKTLIDILSLIDNAEQDVPLCSALLSAMGKMSVDNLTDIRLSYKEDRYFRNACKKYAAEKSDVTAHKLNRFYAYYKELRELSYILSAGELLMKLLVDTRMEATLLSRENGAACLKRIHRFIEETASAEVPSVHGFLCHLRNLDYKIEYSENGGEDSVKVLTMHASKGLEYPVVILDNLSAPFRAADHDEVLVEEKYGLATRAFNTQKMTKADTLLRRLQREKETENSLLDELNLYYVALTRAKYSLHMIFKGKTVFPDVRYAKSFADFTDFSVWEKYIAHEEIFDLQKQERTAMVFHPDEVLAKEIMKAFLWEYQSSGYENLPVKSSATDLISDVSTFAKVQASGKDANADNTVETYVEASVEGTSLSERKTSVDAGLAYHAFLERFDFSLLHDKDGAPISKELLKEVVEGEFSRWTEGELLEIAPLLSVGKLIEILANPVFYELRDMRLYKERQFLVSLPVRDTYAYKQGVPVELREREDGEEMLFQGAIDLLAVGEEEVRIIDYKYSVKDAKALKLHYKKQLELYKRATAKIMKIPLEKIRCTLVNIYLGYQTDVD